MGGGCLPDEMMTEVLRILNKLLTEHFERATERRQKRADEDYDEVNDIQLNLCFLIVLSTEWNKLLKGRESVI